MSPRPPQLRAALFVPCFALAACGASPSPPAPVAATPAATTTASEAPPADGPFDPTPPAGLPDLREIFGTAGGWDLPVVKGLRGGMTPAEVAAVYPGAEPVSSAGFSELKLPIRSVASCTLRFHEGKLFGVTLRFVQTSSPDAFFAYLARFGQHAFGAGRIDTPQKLATWVNRDLRTAQVAWTFDRYKLDFDLPRAR